MSSQENKTLLASLLRRISLVGAVSAVVLSMIVYTQVERTRTVLRERAVAEQSKIIASSLATKANGRLYLSLPESWRRFYAASDDYQYRVTDAAGHVDLSSPHLNAEGFPAPAGAVASPFGFLRPDGEQFIGMTAPNGDFLKPLYVQVALNRATADQGAAQLNALFVDRLLLFGLPFYLGLLGVIAWTVKEGLRPLHSAAEDARKMDIADLSVRIGESTVPGEVLPLVRSVNSSFSRLERSIREQQELTENIAHELRTPLTILKAGIDMLEPTSRTRKLSRDVDGMIKLVNQMLDETRLGYADALKRAPVDLAGVLSQACQDFFPMFVRGGRVLEVSGVERPVWVQGNKDLIYRAICNLLDNALEYGPADAPVEAALEGLTIRVSDGGRKIPAHRAEAIFRRFQKDHAPSATRTGAGLGLSIVAKTMEVHGGYADLEATPRDGNTFRMVFRETA